MTLHIETAGSGPDLVLLHGWAMHGGVWSGVRDDLAQHFRVHVVDLPGHGASASCAPYTLRQLARSVAAAVPQHVAVCGWSLGGQVAARWALDAPQQVSRLILVAATPCFANRTDWKNGVAAQVLQTFADGLARDCGATLKRFLSLQAQGDDDARGLIATLRRTLLMRPAPSVETLSAGLDILLRSDLRAEIARIVQPALVLHGECDRLAPLAAGRWLADQLPQAELRVIGGSAHAPFLSHREEFLEALIDGRSFSTRQA